MLNTFFIKCERSTEIQKEENTRVVANSVKPLSLLIEADVHLVMPRFRLVKALMNDHIYSQ